jgi:surfeit locus 1 family protein
MQLRSQFAIGSFQIRVNWLVAACVLMTVAAFMRLGIWQLDRAAEKIGAQQALETESRINAEAIEDIPPGHLHAANPELQNRHVALLGEYENDRSILLLAEFFEGQIGYGVVTPFRLESNSQLVLVHRGWTTGILPADTPPDLRSVSGAVEATAQIYVAPSNLRIIPSQIDATVWPLRMRSLEIDVISEILDEPLFPFEVRLTANQPGTLVRHWPAVNADVNQNLSYATQWFSFAIAIIFVSLLTSSNLWSLIRGPKA